jgi:hypothetical protein
MSTLIHNTIQHLIWKSVLFCFGRPEWVCPHSTKEACLSLPFCCGHFSSNALPRKTFHRHKCCLRSNRTIAHSNPAKTSCPPLRDILLQGQLNPLVCGVSLATGNDIPFAHWPRSLTKSIGTAAEELLLSCNEVAPRFNPRRWTSRAIRTSIYPSLKHQNWRRSHQASCPWILFPLSNGRQRFFDTNGFVLLDSFSF